MVARLLSDKGVFDLIAAARTLRHRGRAVEIRLAGDRDPSNPNSLTEADIAAIRREGVVTLLGRRTDIAALWRQAHIAVLASTTGEGLPKSLLEAAASGVPIVTTDVPGCRDLVPKGRTGILVPPGDPDALADALDCLAEKPSARRSMGIEARQMVEAEFSDAVVRRQAMDLYRTVLDRGTQAGYGQSGEGERR
jgi:glycosyltransferase involved in cell wall biosynthesis